LLTLRTIRRRFRARHLVDELSKTGGKTPYSYLKRQASNNSGRWVTIEKWVHVTGWRIFQIRSITIADARDCFYVIDEILGLPRASSFL